MPGHFARYFADHDIDNDYPIGKPRSRIHQTEHKPCRACMDFKSWAKSQKVGIPNKVESTNKRSDCPLDKDELGRNTWNFLHTMVAYYPDTASPEVQFNMKRFFNLLTQFYPCATCAEDFAQIITERPPETCSQAKLTQWLCWAHNRVNKKLGKPEFDCSKVNERWLTGWSDDSCN